MRGQEMMPGAVIPPRLASAPPPPGYTPPLDGLPTQIVVTRARLLVAGRGAIKCDLAAAHAFAERHPLVSRVEVGTVRLLADGTEILGPWGPERD